MFSYYYSNDTKLWLFLDMIFSAKKMVGNNNRYMLFCYCACSSLHFEQNKASIRKKNAILSSFCIFLSLKLNFNAPVFILFFFRQVVYCIYKKSFQTKFFGPLFIVWILLITWKRPWFKLFNELNNSFSCKFGISADRQAAICGVTRGAECSRLIKPFY